MQVVLGLSEADGLQLIHQLLGAVVVPGHPAHAGDHGVLHVLGGELLVLVVQLVLAQVLEEREDEVPLERLGLGLGLALGRRLLVGPLILLAGFALALADLLEALLLLAILL